MAFSSRPNSWVSVSDDRSTQLSYGLQLNPAPLTVSIPGHEPVLGSIQFVITNLTATAISLKSVSFRIKVGIDGSNLTSSTATISTSVSDSTKWQIQSPGTITSGAAVYTLQPTTGSSVSVAAGASILVEIINFPTVPNFGVTTINVNETTDKATGYNSFLVTTFPAGFYFHSLSATVVNGSQLTPVAQVPSGAPVTLVWNSSVIDLSSFTIYYSNAAQGQQKATPSDIGTWKSPPLTADTIFTIVVTVAIRGGAPLTAALSTAVVVQNPSLIAASLTAAGATVNGPLTVNGATSTVYVKNTVAIGTGLRIEGTNAQPSLSLGGTGVFNVDAPNIVGGRFTVQNNGNVGINRPNPSATLDVNGNLAVTGQVSLSGNLISSRTTTKIGGWGNPSMPTLQYVQSNNNWCSAGGVRIKDNKLGFGQTRNPGNYGYFGFDLGQSISGLLSVSLVVAHREPGVGLWNIVCSNNPLSGFSGNFQKDTTAVQIWNLYQDISNGQIFGSDPWLVPIQVTVYFTNARSIYIGAVDLNTGPLSLAINSIAVVPLVLG